MLTIRRQNQESFITELELYLINLEIDLIAAAGFTLVLSFITDSHAMKVSPKKKIIIKENEKSRIQYEINKNSAAHNVTLPTEYVVVVQNVVGNFEKLLAFEIIKSIIFFLKYLIRYL